MKVVLMVGAVMIALVGIGLYSYYHNSLDGFTAHQAITRTAGGGEILDDVDSAIGRVVISRGARTDHYGLFLHDYIYSYTVVARRAMPLFWYSYNGGTCTPYSTKNVLATVTYRAHRYNAMLGADNLAADASIVCGYAMSPDAASVAVTWSDATTLTAPVLNGAFFLVNDNVAPACIIQIMNATGDVIETSPVHYTEKDGNWQHTEACD